MTPLTTHKKDCMTEELPKEGTYEDYMYNTCFNLERDGVPKEAIQRLMEESRMYWESEVSLAHQSGREEGIKQERKRLLSSAELWIKVHKKDKKNFSPEEFYQFLQADELYTFFSNLKKETK